MPEQPRSGTLALIARQVRFQTLIFLRTPRAAFFVLFFPLFFMFLFNSLSGGERLDERGGLAFTQFFTPGIAVFAIISACYTNIGIGVSMARDAGILKRVRGTPLPPWVYMAGRIGSSVLIGVVSVAVMLAVGYLAYGLRFFAGTFPAVVVTLVLGAACFCALGLAVTTLVSSGEAAPATVNALLFPILFVSNIFFPVDAAPVWLRAIGWVFPIKHFAAQMQAAFDPRTIGSGFVLDHMLVMAVWFAAAMAFALKTFRWEPAPAKSPRRRRARAAAQGAAG